MNRLLLVALLCLAAPQSSFAADAGDVINALRAERGAAPLRQSGKLERAASLHARDMAKRGFFSHKGSDGSRVGQRAKRVGYRYCTVAENIARGQRSLSEVMEDWLASPAHRRNLLRKDVTQYAVVRASGDVWVMVLGREGC